MSLVALGENLPFFWFLILRFRAFAHFSPMVVQMGQLFAIFAIISKIPKTKVDIVPGTCTGHEAVSPLRGAESGDPGQHPGSQSWVLYLYVYLFH